MEDRTIRQYSENLSAGKSNITAITVPAKRPTQLLYDKRLSSRGIIAEPNGSLIDQAATTQFLGSPIGHTPDSCLETLDTFRSKRYQVALMANHFGWQTGAFLIDRGTPILLANDSSLTGVFPTLCQTHHGWRLANLLFQAGKLLPPFPETISTGFNGPQIVRDGQALPLASYLDDPRLTADPRAVFDFAAGHRPNDSAYFAAIRKLPIAPVHLQELACGRGIMVTLPAESEYSGILNREIHDWGIPEICVDTTENEIYYYVFRDLPLQTSPFFGLGCNKNGDLIVVAVDGRQTSSAGATIPEVAQLLVENGAQDGILGAGGGDVAIAYLAHPNQPDRRILLLNSPSNPDNQSRPAPHVLLF